MTTNKRLVVAITGASGAIYGIRLLKILQELGIQTHLIISPMGARVVREETQTAPEDLKKITTITHAPDDLGAPIASGSFQTDGMLVVPCSIKTLSGIANSYAENLIQRAADVHLKEGRPLLLAVRETPLHAGHLRLMSLAAESGAIIFPPVPAFYNSPETIDALIDATIGRMLTRIGIPNHLVTPYGSDDLPLAGMH